MKPKRLTLVERNIVSLMRTASEKYDKLTDAECLKIWRKEFKKGNPSAQRIYEYADLMLDGLEL